MESTEEDYFVPGSGLLNRNGNYKCSGTFAYLFIEVKQKQKTKQNKYNGVSNKYYRSRFKP